MGYKAHFTPEGKTIYFDHNDDIWTMSADNGSQTNVSNTT
jgi:hypothetical protein